MLGGNHSLWDFSLNCSFSHKVVILVLFEVAFHLLVEGEHAERSSHFGLQELNALLVFAVTEAVESYLF